MSLASWQETLTNSSVDGTANTAGTAASCIPVQNKITLPAGFFQVGKVLRIKAHGRISTVITTPGTLRFDVRVGAVIAWDGLAVLGDTVVAHTNMPFELEITLTCRAVGSGTSANLIGVGKLTSESILGTIASSPKGTVVAMLPWNTAPAVGTGFDSTVANTLDLFFTQTVATGSMTVHGYTVESLN